MAEFERNSFFSNPDEKRPIILLGQTIQPFSPDAPLRQEAADYLDISRGKPVVWSESNYVEGVGSFQIGLRELWKKNTSGKFELRTTPLIPIPVLSLENPFFDFDELLCHVEFGDEWEAVLHPRRAKDEFGILIFDTYVVNGQENKYLALDTENEMLYAEYTLL